MATYNLTDDWSGPYTIPEGGVMQNAGGGVILVDFSGALPTDDDDSLRLSSDYSVVRTTAERTVYARAKNNSARLVVTGAI